ncbi:peptide deformylase [Candidatus Shapirobacteria bacterium]|nr:peptide deformylase [Candidatus Shapirobacteria bacterium]
MIKQILTAPHPLLRQKSKPVGKIDRRIKKVIQDLLLTVKNASEPEGLGLSAVQIGQPLRIFVAKTQKDFEIFLNPEVIFSSKETLKKVLKKEQRFFEGCLSVPGIYGFVNRPYQIKLQWQDEQGKERSRIFKNRLSICLQHELDHLNGLLFVDRLLKQKEKIYQLKKDAKGKDFFEEVEL